MPKVTINPISTVKVFNANGELTQEFPAKVSFDYARDEKGFDVVVNVQEERMKVTCVSTDGRLWLTAGKEYEVLHQTDKEYYIVSDIGMYDFYDKGLFKKEDNMNPYAIFEDSREYTFPTQYGLQKVVVEKAKELRVSDSGHHYLTLEDGTKKIVPPGWIEITIQAKEWTKAPGVQDMCKLGNMTREDLEEYVDAGFYCDQDVIDLYDELQETKKKLEKKDPQ